MNPTLEREGGDGVSKLDGRTHAGKIANARAAAVRCEEIAVGTSLFRGTVEPLDGARLHQPRLGVIVEAMRELAADGREINIVTTYERLAETKRLSVAGGIAYLGSLTNQLLPGQERNLLAEAAGWWSMADHAATALEALEAVS